jgi:biopolymer transport protein ExbD
MAMGSFNAQGNQAPTAEINMTPLVDVMLVLLIIFIITAPLMTHAVKVDLPRVSSTPNPEKPATLQVAIAADDAIYVGSDKVDAAALEKRFRTAVEQDAKVELHLKADKESRYEAVAETMSAARRAGIGKIGFVTQPGSQP